MSRVPGAHGVGTGGEGSRNGAVHAENQAGERIGRYKLLHQIGEGGCGIVFMAEQEEPLRRRVARKVIKLGMDTKQVIARFEAERQALALMDHPNIAKVLDAGATETGRPYFVMELVRGIKITDYCDRNNLSTEERLQLFTQVCQAVQHAHQKGIIHRDIKPSNILVTISEPGASGCPKIIDFGIAKATTGQHLTDKTLFTAFEQFVGTPAYMSPEQAMMTALDIDTRTDIYSLGVLLYELLTGKTPLDQTELLAAGLEEMRRTIREKEPARPSTRLSTMLEAELTATAKHRHTDAPKLIHLLRGDLDWIVMKALEKDRARRYETANGLAMDIQRHLNCEPVAARPPSRLYEFQKMVRRHKFGFAAAAAVIVALVVGLGLATFGLLQARAQRNQAQASERSAQREKRVAEEARARALASERLAESEASKSQQVAQFMKDMLQGVGPKVALGRDTLLLREILANTAERTGRDLKNQPAVAAELLSTIGATYLQLFDLGKAEAMQREALRLRRSLFAETNAAVAGSLNDLARVLIIRRGAEDVREAEAMARQAVSILEKVSGKESEEVALSLYLVASALYNQGRLAEAERTYRQSLAMRRRLFGNENKDVASSLDNLGLVLRLQHRPEEAEQAVREAMEIQKKLFGEEHPDVADSVFNLGRVLWDEHRLAEAEAAFRQSLAMRRKLMGNEHPQVAVSLDYLATLCRTEGKLAEAEALYRECLAIRENKLPNDFSVFFTRSGLGAALLRQQKYKEAEPLLLGGYEGLKQRVAKIPPVGHPPLRDVLQDLVQLYEETNRPDQAAEWKQKLTEFDQAAK